MIYYLHKGGAPARFMIDNVQHGGWEIVEAKLAKNWVAAKKAFGFELTELQKQMMRR